MDGPARTASHVPSSGVARWTEPLFSAAAGRALLCRFIGGPLLIRPVEFLFPTRGNPLTGEWASCPAAIRCGQQPPYCVSVNGGRAICLRVACSYLAQGRSHSLTMPRCYGDRTQTQSRGSGCAPLHVSPLWPSCMVRVSANATPDDGGWNGGCEAPHSLAPTTLASR